MTTLKEALLREYDLEMEYVRRHLERVPEGKGDWKPAEKSMQLGWLSGFLAILPSWATSILENEFYDVNPPTPTQTPSLPKNNGELLALFDKNVAEGRAALAKFDDATLEKPWSLKAAGKTLWSQPRWLVLKTFFLNHCVHHRAQLGVYLRLLGIPVPAVYNDSADDKGGMFIDVPQGARA
jgi:uncharacterized damage-inducible protein DinB